MDSYNWPKSHHASSVPEAAGSTSATVSPVTSPAAEATPQRSNAAAMPIAPSQTGVSPSSDIALPATSAERAGVSEGLSPEEYVRQAKQEFDAGHVEQALDILERMKQRYPSGTDEAWWLLGQLYESNSSVRDIKLSLEYYRRLVNEYPQSNRVDDARRRIAYLERYYLNIR